MKSKRIRLVLLFFMVGFFIAGTAFAEEWYTVEVVRGYVDADAGGGWVITAPEDTAVQNLNPAHAPFVTVGTIDPLRTSPFPTPPAGDTDGWNALGWWEFKVTGSSGSGWNDVFGGGNYTFTADWLSAQFGAVHFGVLNTTFDAMYGKWIQNNPSVWTYFGLYFAPNTGEAQNQDNYPIGIFAFLADDPLLYPSGFDLSGLYQAAHNGEVTVSGGTGIFRAVPEPATMLLLGLGLLGLAGIRRKM
jgi:hypothetical protein